MLEVSRENGTMITEALSSIDNLSTQVADIESRVIEFSDSERSALPTCDEAFTHPSLLSELEQAYTKDASLVRSGSTISLVSFSTPATPSLGAIDVDI